MLARFGLAFVLAACGKRFRSSSTLVKRSLTRAPRSSWGIGCDQRPRNRLTDSERSRRAHQLTASRQSVKQFRLRPPPELSEAKLILLQNACKSFGLASSFGYASATTVSHLRYALEHFCKRSSNALCCIVDVSMRTRCTARNRRDTVLANATRHNCIEERKISINI